jgi:hypothetical protein
MSAITDIVTAYASGEIDFGQAREQLRQVPIKALPSGGYDYIDTDSDGTVGELGEIAFALGVSPEEYSLLARSLSATPVGSPAREEERPERAREEPDLLSPEPLPPTLTTDSTVSIVKKDARRNLVFGWANVAMTDGGQVEDHQGHLIDLDDLESAAYRFVAKYRLSGDMHQGEGFGELVESLVVTEDKVEKGGFPRSMLGHWWVGFKVPPEHWDKVQKGDRVMFSIQGKARLEPADD